MQLRGTWLILAALAVCGCTSNLADSAIQRDSSLRLLADSNPQVTDAAYASDDDAPAVESAGGFATAGDDGSDDHSSSDNRSLVDAVDVELPMADVESIPTAEVSAEPARQSSATIKVVAMAEPGEEVAEEVPAPAPAAVTPYKPAAEDESKFDRFQRQIVDVPVDIRPTEGLLPENVGAEKFAAEPTIDESLPSGEPANIFCSYTPWTICYRPLYFEDIGLERYGKNVGCLQTGLSGVRFFGSVAALPYKMTRRPPRSCECSNGFSRPGDCPLPGYGNRRFQWNAALVEAAMVTAVVYIIP